MLVQEVRPDVYAAVEKDQQRRGGQPGAGVAGQAHPVALVRLEVVFDPQLLRRLFDDRAATVRRTVVSDDDLEFVDRHPLPGEVPQRLTQQVPPVVGRDDHRHPGNRACCPSSVHSASVPTATSAFISQSAVLDAFMRMPTRRRLGDACGSVWTRHPDAPSRPDDPPPGPPVRTACQHISVRGGVPCLSSTRCRARCGPRRSSPRSTGGCWCIRTTTAAGRSASRSSAVTVARCGTRPVWNCWTSWAPATGSRRSGTVGRNWLTRRPVRCASWRTTPGSTSSPTTSPSRRAAAGRPGPRGAGPGVLHQRRL